MRKPTSTVVNQSGIASPRLIDSCVVGVKVYGNRPIKFIVRRKVSREMNKKAHLCAGVLKGRRSCFMDNSKNQLCRVCSRLRFHRNKGVGVRSQGNNIAIRMRETFIRVAGANWSNKFIVKFRFRFAW